MGSVARITPALIFCLLLVASASCGGESATEPVTETVPEVVPESEPEPELGPETVVADGVFWLKRCRPESMSPGYTLVYPLEGSTLYWFHECKVVRTMDMPGRVGVVRQAEGSIYGLVGSSILAFGPDGERQFAVYNDYLPGPAHHDVILTSRGTYMALTKVRVGEGIFDDVIVEVTTSGEILWTWSVNEHLLGAPDGSSALEGEGWIHSNSLDLYDDGDILLSARNLDMLVRIDYPTGDTMWTRGQDILSKQHHANLTPEEQVAVFDNGNRGKESGALLFDPDGQVALEQRLGFFSDAFGSAELQPNGNWLVVDGRGGRVLEYTEDFSRIVFELKLLRGNYVPYARDPDDPIRAFLYRAHRVPELP